MGDQNGVLTSGVAPSAKGWESQTTTSKGHLIRAKKCGRRILTSIISNLHVAEAVSKAGNFCGGGSDRGKGEIRRQTVEVCLLCLEEEVTRVQNRVIGLWGTCSVKKGLLEEAVIEPS